MARHLAWALVGLLVIPTAGATAEVCGQPASLERQSNPPQAPRQGPPAFKKWWMDEPMRSDLALTDQQSAAVELVWQKSAPRLREMRERLDQLEDVLSQMIRDAVDESTVVSQIDRVEKTRAEANKTRTLMLYRMNRVLTSEQRAKLKVMHDQREAAHRGSAPSDRRRH